MILFWVNFFKLMEQNYELKVKTFLAQNRRVPDMEFTPRFPLRFQNSHTIESKARWKKLVGIYWGRYWMGDFGLARAPKTQICQQQTNEDDDPDIKNDSKNRFFSRLPTCTIQTRLAYSRVYISVRT